MRIGLTGASGFIGSHLADALKKLPGATVAALQRKDKNSPPPAEELKGFVEGKDLIYHVGGVNRGTDEEILRGNISGTLNLIAAVKTFGPPSIRIVFASSSQVYGVPGKTPVLRESHAAEPATIYGIGKKAAEDLIRLSGLDHIILRLSNVYGPGCRPNYNSVIATFCERAARGLPLTIDGDGAQGRDFIYIDDVVRAFVLAGTGGKKSGHRIFNVSSGKITTLNQVVDTLRSAGGQAEITYRPREEPGEPAFCCDPARYHEEYGRQSETSFADGIAQTLRWFNERLGA